MLSDTPDQPAKMASDLDPARCLARTKDDGDRAGTFGVIDVDRQKTPLVIVSIEQRQLLLAMNDVAGPYNTLPMSRPRDPSRS
jgi:hypothetical protein